MGKKHQVQPTNYGAKSKTLIERGPAGKHDPRYIKTTPPIRRPGFVAKK